MSKDSYPTHLYNDELQCVILGATIDFDQRSCGLFFLPLHHCDMSGAIRFVTRMYPKVEAIATYSGDKRDSVYRLDDGVWGAFKATGKINSLHPVVKEMNGDNDGRDR